MVSVSPLEVIFSKSNVCVDGVIVAPGDSGLVDDRRLEAISIERACILLSIVTCFVVFCVCGLRGCVRMSSRCVCCGSDVTDLDGVWIEDFSNLVVFREVIVY